MPKRKAIELLPMGMDPEISPKGVVTKGLPLIFGEAAIVAVCNLAGIVIQAAESHRDGMSQENKDRADKLFLNGLERADEVLAWIHKQFFKP